MTKLIAHRGNIKGISPEQENKPEYIDLAISNGFDVEIDIRLLNSFLFLGHDNPDYEINLEWLIHRKNNLWIHTKNFEALNYLIDCDLKIFYHQKEDHTIINNSNLIWSHNLSEANFKSIIPLLSLDDIAKFDKRNVFGICSDFVYLLK